MENADYSIILDVTDMSAPVSLNVKQGDAGRVIAITLARDGVPLILERGSYAVFAGKKPDEKILWNSCSIRDSTIFYEITRQTTAVVGWVPVQIRLYRPGGKLVSSPDFVLIVDGTVTDDEEVVIVSENEVTALTELVSEAADAIEHALNVEGKSAYQVAQESGFEGTVEEWLDSLVGPKGDKGDPGPQGDPGKEGGSTTITLKYGVSSTPSMNTVTGWQDTIPRMSETYPYLWIEISTETITATGGSSTIEAGIIGYYSTPDSGGDGDQQGFDIPATKHLKMGNHDVTGVRSLDFVNQSDDTGDRGVYVTNERSVEASGNISGEVLAFYGSYGDEPVVLRNIHDPVEDRDAATKKYVDEHSQNSGGTVEVDTTLTKEGMAADAKAVGDALKEVGQPTDEQIAGAVSDWLDEHPEATTTVADGAITPVKTSFMPENVDVIATLDDVKANTPVSISSKGTYTYHAWIKNKSLSINVEGLGKIVVKAFASYINWIQTATEVTASGVPVISNGYTTENPSGINATADTDIAEMREVEIDVAEGARYILIDFGVTAPTYLTVETPNGTYRFSEDVKIEDKLNRPKNDDGDFADGEEGQVLYANGEKPYWGSKINPGDVNAKATTFWGSDALGISVKCEPLPKIEIDWQYTYQQFTGVSGSCVYHLAVTNRNSYLIKLEAGKTYVINLVNQNVRYFTKLPTIRELTDTEKSNLEYAGYNCTNLKYVEGARSWGMPQMNGCKITPDVDMYIIGRQSGAVDEDKSSEMDIYVDGEVEYLSDLTPAEVYTFTNVGSDVGVYGYPFTFNKVSYGGRRLAYYRQYETDENMRRLIRQTDYLDAMALSNIKLCFIGDSITYAASNAGLQRAFRKMVPYKLQVTSKDTAVAGTCMTNGFGIAWSCGTQGVDGLLTDATYIETVPDNPFERPHIFMIALGTNDFGNDAPLGDVEAEDRDTTFAGCYLKLVEAIRANYPKSGIILMCPFNRNDGSTANANGDILLDYSRVIHEIASFTPHTWVLDLSNHPLINYAGYPEGYVDGVHIGKYAHAVVSNELYRLIMEIVAVSGFDYLPCLDDLNA